MKRVVIVTFLAFLAWNAGALRVYNARGQIIRVGSRNLEAYQTSGMISRGIVKSGNRKIDTRGLLEQDMILVFDDYIIIYDPLKIDARSKGWLND